MNQTLADQVRPPAQILIVDDLMDNATLLATVLELEGYSVEIATCGYTAIAKIEAHPPQLALIDGMMPELDGFELAHWIRQNRPSVATVLVTANDQLIDASRSGLAARLWDGYLRKPISFEQVLATVDRLLQSPTLVPTDEARSVGQYFR